MGHFRPKSVKIGRIWAGLGRTRPNLAGFGWLWREFGRIRPALGSNVARCGPDLADVGRSRQQSGRIRFRIAVAFAPLAEQRARAACHEDLESFAVRLPTESMRLASKGRVTASVSSFGFGGTNGHVVLQTATAPGGAAIGRGCRRRPALIRPPSHRQVWDQPLAPVPPTMAHVRVQVCKCASVGDSLWSTSARPMRSGLWRASSSCPSDDRPPSKLLRGSAHTCVPGHAQWRRRSFERAPKVQSTFSRWTVSVAHCRLVVMYIHWLGTRDA